MASESSRPSSGSSKFRTFLSLVNTALLLGIFVLLIVAVIELRNLKLTFDSSDPITVDVRTVHDIITGTLTGPQTITGTVGLLGTQVVQITQRFGDTITVTGA